MCALASRDPGRAARLVLMIQEIRTPPPLADRQDRLLYGPRLTSALAFKADLAGGRHEDGSHA